MSQIPTIPQQSNYIVHISQTATANRASTQTADFSEAEESPDSDDEVETRGGGGIPDTNERIHHDHRYWSRESHMQRLSATTEQAVIRSNYTLKTIMMK
jgi:hypothetical protein